MSKIENLRNLIFDEYGTVQRARNCFLYTKKGVRLTDLYQEGGRAILGWGGSSIWTMFKNTLSRGITGSFKSEIDGQIKKAVSKLFDSEREIYIYESREQALKSCLSIFPSDTMNYRPWNPEPIQWASQKCIIFMPTVPIASNIFIVCVLKEALTEESRIFFHSTIIPSPVEAAIARSVYNLISAIQEREEKHWFIYDQNLSSYWTRKGPYLFPKVPEEKYDDFIAHCLKNKIVISPEYNVPSIVPFGADKGVFTSLKNNPFQF